MKNDLLSIGGFTIHGYGLMIGLGVLAAYLLSDYRAGKKGLNQDHVFGLCVCVVAAGFVSAKLLYYVTVLDEIVKNPRLLLDVANGFVVYGSLAGGILGAYWYSRRHKMNFFAYADLILPAVALAQGLGRIGCFLAGCCYGVETDGNFAVMFRDSAYAPNGVNLLPVQLISSGLNFVHFLVLMWLSGKMKRDGQVTGTYLVLYSAGRFILEFFRGDLARGTVGSLTTSQFISLFAAMAGVAILARSRSHPETAER